jgi:Double zinc ribbon/Phospholipase_D-nuclease N-terminal
MTIKNQPSTRFRDELRLVSLWVRIVALLLFLAAPVLFVWVIGMDRHAPPLPIRALLGILAGTMLGCYIMLVGYINQDAGRRRMSRLIWTLIAICVPNGLGVVLYFVLRKPRTPNCPRCEAEVDPSFSFCPRCRTALQPVCAHCQRGVGLGDKFCPYCGETLESAPVVTSEAAVS